MATQRWNFVAGGQYFYCVICENIYFLQHSIFSNIPSRISIYFCNTKKDCYPEKGKKKVLYKLHEVNLEAKFDLRSSK